MASLLIDSLLQKQEQVVTELKGFVKQTCEDLESRVATLSQKFFTYQDSQAEIIVSQGDLHRQNVEECLARCELLAEEVLKATGLTSDQIFNLRREMGTLDAQSASASYFLTLINSYLHIDPQNYGSLKDARASLSENITLLEEKLGPLWGVVGQFDNNIAQSINLVMTLQTGFLNQEQALKKLEREILRKADANLVINLEKNAKELEDASSALKTDVKKVTGDMHNLSSNNADLSTKVYDLYDKMDNIVDEEKLKDAVKSLLDLYVRQLEAKADGNTKLVEELQLELEKTGGAVNDLFRTKADVSDVSIKADKEAVDETSATLQQLQRFVKQFEKELETVRSGQSGDLDKIKRNMERRLTKAMLGQPEKKDDEVVLSHRKLDLCLACNRPLGKSVNLSKAAAYYGPVDDPTNQVYGRRRSTIPPNMLIHLQGDKRRSTSFRGLPKSRPNGLFSGGFNLPVKKGIWNDDLGGTGDTISEEPSEAKKVRRTLAGMSIDPGDAPDTPQMRWGSMGKKVAKDWMKVTSAGVTVEGGEEGAASPKNKNLEALKREARKSSVVMGGRARGSSLRIVKSPKAASSPNKGGLSLSASTTKLPQIK